MERRKFLRNSALITTGVILSQNAMPAQSKLSVQNKLPRWKGFNLLDYFSPNPSNQRSSTQEDHFKWMRDWGFDFVRLPMAYPNYLNIDRSKNITADDVYKIDESKVDEIEKLVLLAHKYNLHVSLNLHRAPGYCINAGFHEPFNLWTDAAAQDAFSFHWGLWAKRFKNVSRKKISFDLLNEPSMREDMNDQHSNSSAVPGDVYRKVALSASNAIRKENKDHLIIADGNNVGNSVIPELIDLDIAQSCRGYRPGAVSHFKAPWANKDPEHMPTPQWPGQSGNRQMLENYYQPWVDLIQKGVGVHCGECGCWNKTPHDVFIAWFTDVLDILGSHQIGFAIWNFIGDFGILDSGRIDIAYEDWNGHKLDRKLLDLLRKS